MFPSDAGGQRGMGGHQRQEPKKIPSEEFREVWLGQSVFSKLITLVSQM